MTDTRETSLERAGGAFDASTVLHQLRDMLTSAGCAKYGARLSPAASAIYADALTALLTEGQKEPGQ